MSTSIEHDGTAVDVKLFETIGLYKLMRPASRGGDRYRKAGFAVLCWAVAALVVAATTQFVQFNWMIQKNMYDIRHIVYAPILFTYGTMCVYKGLTVIKHGDRMRSTLDVAKYEYTSIGRRDATELRQCRGRVSVWLRVYVVFSMLTVLMWCVEPWTTAAVEDGGAHAVVVWAMYNIAETCVICINTVCYSMFDCYLVTVCFVLNAQYRSVARAYSSIGWHSRQQSSSKPTGT